MSSSLQRAILISWRRNGAYALRLVGGVSHSQMSTQPVPGRVMNHPSWVLSHLALYTEVSAALARGTSFQDPIDHVYGQKSEPLDAKAYEPRDVLVERYRAAHIDAELALEQATDATLGSPPPIERWRAQHPTVGDMLVTLMVKHESAHLGQLSAWRRAMGLPRVAL